VQGVLDGIPIVLVLLAGIGAPLAGWYATRRLRSPGVWFFLGALTGPIALGLLALAPPGRCPMCDTPVRGWPTTCDRCGVRLQDGEEPEPYMVAGTTAATAASSVAAPRSARLTEADGASAFAPPTPIGSARTATRRDPGAPWPTDKEMASPMSLGVRPTFTASNYMAATHEPEVTSGDVLSTGVYISGNAGLEFGACYAIARDGDQLRVFGPVDAGQLTVRHEGPIKDYDVTAMDDRVIIAGREGRSSLAIVFRTIGGMRAADLELALGGTIAGAGP
jgi:hypothetical protein